MAGRPPRLDTADRAGCFGSDILSSGATLCSVSNTSVTNQPA